jgi:hypothetical protein
MSEVRADTITASDGSSPVTLTKQSAAKAWMYYKQNTPAISDSFNTSSATDTGTGNYLQNYTNSFDASYDGRAMSGSSFISDKIITHGLTGATTGAQQFNVYDIGSAALDDSFSSVVTHGDLA